MNISNSAAPEPSDRLAPASYQALDEAQDKARSMQAREVYPEHLLLVLLEQGYHRTTKALHNLQADNLVKFQNQIITVGTWHDIEERYIRDEVLKAKITGYNKEGLIATVSGCNLTHNFAKRGRYASEGEKGEVMCQITKDFPGAYEQDVSRCD